MQSLVGNKEPAVGQLAVEVFGSLEADLGLAFDGVEVCLACRNVEAEVVLVGHSFEEVDGEVVATYPANRCT